MWKLFEKIYRTPLATEPSHLLPPAPEGSRGVPEIKRADCADCPTCVQACPAAALSYNEHRLKLDLSVCLMCGVCAEECPDVITQTTGYALATRTKARLSGDTIGDPEPLEQESEALAAQIRAVLGRSVHVRHVDAGSCNGCDWELTHLLNPVYDLQRFGIDFVASPRHADLLLVTGGVTRHLEDALRRTLEAAGEPKLVVAIGTCAIGGGIIGETYANHGGVDKVVPVNVYVPGCPPRPEAILHGIFLALGGM